MMAAFLKTGSTDAEKNEDNNSIKSAVEATLSEIEKHGDAAVIELSKKFDNWAPETFRLSEKDIDSCLEELTEENIKDIKFAQAQVRNFAELQRTAITDIEVETLPGVILGHKNIPINSVGCYVPGGKYPMVASAHMSIVTAGVAGVKRIIAASPPFQGKPNPAVIAAMHLAGAT